MIKYIEGDIHDVIKTLETDSIDFIYTDPPFGTTQASWDKGLNWEELFPEMWRVLKPRGIICLYASIPFTYELLQFEKPKYHYSWKKNKVTCFFGAKKFPLRQIEEIFIYYKKPGTYNPQMVGKEWNKKHYWKVGNDKQKYYGVRKNIEKAYVSKTEGHTGKYPTTFKDWKVRSDGSGISRTDEQIDYFIKTYSNEGDTILDMTNHTHYVGDRCKLLNRNYLGIDIKQTSENLGTSEN